MQRKTSTAAIVTEQRLAFAVKLADQIAERDLSATGYECAEKAVRKVFGRWLLDVSAAVMTNQLPLYYRLVDEVEKRLGLHRRRKQTFGPHGPGRSAWFPISAPLEMEPGRRSAIA